MAALEFLTNKKVFLETILRFKKKKSCPLFLFFVIRLRKKKSRFIYWPIYRLLASKYKKLSVHGISRNVLICAFINVIFLINLFI